MDQDILVITGLNNVRFESLDVIMGRIESFTAEVMEQSRIFHPSNPSTLSFITLLYPPQFCWLESNGPVPYEGYVNKLDMMIALNYQIIEHNDRVLLGQLDLYRTLCDGVAYEESCATKFHTNGLRNERKVEIRSHKWEMMRRR